MIVVAQSADKRIQLACYRKRVFPVVCGANAGGSLNAPKPSVQFDLVNVYLHSVVLVIVAMSALFSPAMAAEYVPGMRCDQVGGFAESVAAQKSLGDTLKEQIDGMRQSAPDYPRARHALEMIIRGIYASRALRTASPEDVGKAYERTCVALSR